MEFYREELLRRINLINPKSDYKKKFLDSYDRTDSRVIQLCSNIYIENKKQIKVHFNEFIDFIFYQKVTPEQLFYNSFYLKKYHKNRQSYRRKKNHKKKILSEETINKREWRKMKKYKDERSKKNHFDYSDYYREHNYKSLRRWTKMRLRLGDFNLEKKWKKHNHFNTEWLW